jgi:serine/threonine protein phosphatase PrpC
VTLSLRFGARSDVGLAREGNEDALYAGPRLLAVADGMGGHAAGEVASRVVIEALAPLDESPPDGELTDALRRAVETANGYLRDMVAADTALEGMGTTLTALLWVQQTLGLVHIGDSRAYLLRDGVLQQVTHDHTFVQTLIDQGRITPDEANTHPQRSWITNALDGRPDIELDLSIQDVRVGDRYMVCSDGLSSYVSEETLEETLRDGDPQSACDQLVDLALRAGGLDNITCIVADIVDEDGTTGDAILGGAAADGQAAHPEAPTDSPAARAAAIHPRRPEPEAEVESTPLPPSNDEAPPPRRRSRRLPIVLALVALIVIGGAVATFFYIRTLYYVGVAQGSTPTVGVYRGVQGSVLGLDLESLADRSDVPISALPADDRARVNDGIDADGRADAERIVTALRGDACAVATATPQPSPSSSPTTTHKRRHARRAPSPTPTPTPPAYCSGSS